MQQNSTFVKPFSKSLSEKTHQVRPSDQTKLVYNVEQELFTQKGEFKNLLRQGMERILKYNSSKEAA